VVRLLVCGPQLEDWMLDVTLSDEPSVDVYVWNTMHRERLFKRAEEALRQARRWALSLIECMRVDAAYGNSTLAVPITSRSASSFSIQTSISTRFSAGSTWVTKPFSVIVWPGCTGCR
jgi:hypothetical protein